MNFPIDTFYKKYKVEVFIVMGYVLSSFIIIAQVLYQVIVGGLLYLLGVSSSTGIVLWLILLFLSGIVIYWKINLPFFKISAFVCSGLFLNELLFMASIQLFDRRESSVDGYIVSVFLVKPLAIVIIYLILLRLKFQRFLRHQPRPEQLRNRD